MKFTTFTMVNSYFACAFITPRLEVPMREKLMVSIDTSEISFL
jgi:hypothetical protein